MSVKIVAYQNVVNMKNLIRTLFCEYVTKKEGKTYRPGFKFDYWRVSGRKIAYWLLAIIILVVIFA